MGWAPAHSLAPFMEIFTSSWKAAAEAAVVVAEIRLATLVEVEALGEAQSNSEQPDCCTSRVRLTFQAGATGPKEAEAAFVYMARKSSWRTHTNFSQRGPVVGGSWSSRLTFLSANPHRPKYL